MYALKLNMIYMININSPLEFLQAGCFFIGCALFDGYVALAAVIKYIKKK